MTHREPNLRPQLSPLHKQAELADFTSATTTASTLTSWLLFFERLSYSLLGLIHTQASYGNTFAKHPLI